MILNHSLKALLVASTGLAITIPAVAADKAVEQSQTGQNGMERTSDLNVVTQARKLSSMPVVESNGNELGKIHDLVVSAQNQSVLYALVSASAADLGDKIYPIPFSSLKIAKKNAMHGSNEKNSERKGQSRQQKESQARAEGGNEQQNTATGSSTQASAKSATSADSQSDEGQSEEEASRQSGGMGANDGYGQTGQQTSSFRELNVDRLVGMPVQNAAGETISDVENLIVGQNDRPRAILGVGGFLGIGEKWIAVSLDKLRLAENGESLVTSMTLQDLENAGSVEYDDSQVVEGNRTVGSLMGQTNSGSQNQQSEQQVNKNQDMGQTKSQNADNNGNRNSKSASANMSNGAQSSNKAEQQKQTNNQAGDSASDIQAVEGKVLVLDISKSEFANAPSFAKDSFPNMAEQEWHDSVIAFYEDILGKRPDMRLPSFETGNNKENSQ